MNKKVVAFVVAIFLLSPVLLSIETKAQDSWPMFHYDPNHTGYTISWGPGTNQTLWIYETFYDIFGPSPAVVNGMLYIAGGFGPTLYALNASTGEHVWNYTRFFWIASSPAVADDTVYFGSYGGNVTALNATTGAFVWNYTTGGWIAASSPCVLDGTVYIGGGYGGASLDPAPTPVYALNATTGAKIWNYTTGDWVHSSPAVADGVVYVGSYDDNLYAFNATTGAKIWNYTTEGDVFSSPAVVDGVVYVGSNDNNVYALNASTGEKIWNYTTGYWVASSPAVVDGVVCVGSYDNNVYALNAATGAKIWNYTTGGAVSSSPAVAGGVVYVGSGDNKTYALCAATGAKIWSYTTGGDVFASPAVVDGVVYAASRDGKIYAFYSPPPWKVGFDAVWDQVTYRVTVISDSSISSFNFSQPDMQISFDVTGLDGTSSFCNVTIPKALLSDNPWTVKMDNAQVTPNIAENDTHTFLQFDYVHASTLHVMIKGTWVIPEFPTVMILPLFVVGTLVAILLWKKTWSTRRKGSVVAKQK